MATSMATGSSLARMQPHQWGRFPMGPSPSPAMRASQTQRCGRVTDMMSMNLANMSGVPWLDCSAHGR